MKKSLLMAGVAGMFAVTAQAQNSVTLYGLIDSGLTYTSNDAASQGATWRATSNLTSGSRFGLRGAEELGGGLKVVFALENGFDVDTGRTTNGAQRLFGRQAFVGLSGERWGTVSVGRQYDAMVDYLSPLSLAYMDDRAGGYVFSHPFDNDNLGGTFRLNNAFKYTSANYSGFSFGGIYGASNGGKGLSDSNRAYSVGMKYDNGLLRLAAAFTTIKDPNSPINFRGAVSDDYRFDADKQYTFGVGGSYVAGPATVGLVWTQTRFDNYLGLVGYEAILNNYEINGKYAVSPAWMMSAAYVFTDLHYQQPNTSRKGNIQQVNLMSDYSLSKRTDVYLAAAYQDANADSTNASIIGASGTSSQDSQVVVTTGVRHRF